MLPQETSYLCGEQGVDEYRYFSRGFYKRTLPFVARFHLKGVPRTYIESRRLERGIELLFTAGIKIGIALDFYRPIKARRVD